ncbi:MAG: biopolymer transporter ExbD [bacterium]|nr:biopolymer transporter ExbD [bacterium]
MLRGGTIIRLIDVVLIILLGFLGITDFEIKSQIKLPSTFNSGQQEIKQHFIFVTVKGDSSFELVVENNRIEHIQGIGILEQFLIRLNYQYHQELKQMVVVIEPDLETKIQTTVDVMDVCEKHQILKSLSYSQIGLN